MARSRVNPSTTTPTHHVSLSDGVYTWGLKLRDGPSGIREIPQTPSTLHFTGGGTKFGDWEPGISHIEQRDWSGGRGSDDFSLDSTRFYDSHNLFSMIEGRIFPSLYTFFTTSQDVRESYKSTRWNVAWKPLVGSTQYVAGTFTVGGSDFAADNVSIWLRRIGAPTSNLTVEIWTNSASAPNAIVTSATASVSTSDITDYESVWKVFDLSAAGNLTASTAYWVVIYADAADNAANHWEIGHRTDEDAGAESANGSSWTTSVDSIYFRVTGADVDRDWGFFELRGALYAYTKPANNSASALFINCDTGKATSATSTTLVDTNTGLTTWSDDGWNAFYVKIVEGTGKGQHRKITDSTSGGTLTVAAWDITPDTTSIYVIYGGSTWTDVSPSAGLAFTESIVDHVVYNQFVAFGLNGANLKCMKFDDAASPPVLDWYDDTANDGEYLITSYNPTDGVQVWAADIDAVNVARAAPNAWDADFSFGTAISVGDSSSLINNMVLYNNVPFVFKDDGVWTVASDIPQKLNVGLSFIRSANNGAAAAVHNGSLFFSWGDFALMQLIGNDVISVGPDRGAGLPSNRRGRITRLVSHPAGLFAVVDGGDSNYSSVMFRSDDTFGWHEVFRGWETGQRITGLYWQDTPGRRPFLFIAINGEVIHMAWPQQTLNPLQDTGALLVGIPFQQEASVVLADIDMGAARLPKFFKEVTLISENLTAGIEVHLDYQADADIGGATWYRAGTFYQSPEDTLPLSLGNKRKLRLRLRLTTTNSVLPPVIRGTIVEAYARTPVKKQWQLDVLVRDDALTLQATPDHKKDEIFDWLNDAAESAKKIYMRSVWKEIDEKLVIVEPYSYFRDHTSTFLKQSGGILRLVVREA